LVTTGLTALLGLSLGFPAVASAQADEQVIDLSTDSEQARTHFWAGMEETHNVSPGAAFQQFELAVAADPDWGIAQVMRAQSAAVPNSERLEAITQGVAAMGGATSDELLIAAAIRAFRSGNGSDAAHMVGTLSRSNPDDPYAAFWAAQTAPGRDSQMDAVAMWEGLIEDFPDYAPSHNMLAYARWGVEDKSGAIEAVRGYLRLAPDHPNPHDSYAEMLQGIGHYADALTHYGHAASRGELYDAAHTGMAETYVLMGDFPSAARHMEMAAEIARAPNIRVNHLRGAAAAYMLDGDRTAAMNALAEAVEAAPNDNSAGFVHLQMALTAGMMGRGGDVADHLTQAGELTGGDDDTHYGLSALAHAAAGHGDQAMEAAGHLTDADPFWHAVGQTARAMVLLEDGDAQGAMEELRSVDPTNPMVRAVMADALDDLDREVEAEALRADVLGQRWFALANPFIGAARYVARDD
jgi:predicted Zn-dependent protease